ncbi:hypothetical protein [Paraliobacillus ryukyuensis]|uniref:hypothetical protein n=1 Tax=Paraliobacillus ryukyuensis TaxID=200904 RepID=UPI0009A599BF|nr:hypothetical protein [Paraliobacillus ryukyuensis]
MKKVLLALGLLVTFVITGCAQNSDEADTTDDQATTSSETENAEKSADDTANVKKALLDTQMNLVHELTTYQPAINDYTAAAADETSKEEDVKAAKEAAKTAASEVSGQLEGYEIQTELPEAEKEQYAEAIATLQTYYQQVATALEANVGEVDLSEADATWEDFQGQINEIYEAADLIAPDMKDALS